jgi:hypothetical protein
MSLTGSQIQLLLECLKYGIQRVSEAQDTPYAVKQENLQRLTVLQAKLKVGRDEIIERSK